MRLVADDLLEVACARERRLEPEPLLLASAATELRLELVRLEFDPAPEAGKHLSLGLVSSGQIFNKCVNPIAIDDATFGEISQISGIALQ